jgi:hypothetical protein
MIVRLALAILLVSPLARAAEDTVTLNFVNADIDAVVKAVAEITGRNFVIDPRVKGTVNIVSARPCPEKPGLPDASFRAAAAGLRRRRKRRHRQDRARGRRQATGGIRVGRARWAPAATGS